MVTGLSAMFKKLDAAPGTLIIYIDGVPQTAQEQESVAAVLSRQGEFWSRETPGSGSRRAPYCMMGVCFECLATVDGVSSTQTCLVTAKEGMRVERQIGARKIV
jgi:hypothetical protein